MTFRPRAGRGPVNFWETVAYPVPAYVLFTLMGIPDADVPKIKQYGASRGAMTWGDPSDEEQIAIAHDMVAYWKYIHDLLDMRRANPGDDFPSDLLRLQAEGAEITDDEIAGVLYSTLFAGHETTSTFMGNYVLTMMDNRDAWDAIKADPVEDPQRGGRDAALHALGRGLAAEGPHGHHGRRRGAARRGRGPDDHRVGQPR